MSLSEPRDPVSRDEILSRFSDSQKSHCGEALHEWENVYWTLYDLVHNDIKCPSCGHPCATTFYSCGDMHCCSSHCGCECMWGTNQVSKSELDALLARRSEYRFVERAPGHWEEVALVTEDTST